MEISEFTLRFGMFINIGRIEKVSCSAVDNDYNLDFMLFLFKSGYMTCNRVTLQYTCVLRRVAIASVRG